MNKETTVQHTPGPWKIFGDYSAITAPDGRTLGKSSGRNALESEANFHLITAAPELLKFAKHVMSWADSPGVNNNTQRTLSIKGLRAAISKAEGR